MHLSDDRRRQRQSIIFPPEKRTDVDLAADINRHQVLTESNPTGMALCDDTKHVGWHDVRIV
jgi:hypothetical protein